MTYIVLGRLLQSLFQPCSLTSEPHSDFQTPIFEIIAGPSREVFFAHAGILAKSKVLQRDVDGWASETETRKIVWEEWDADVVDKFLEWLYTGDYTITYPTTPRSAPSGLDSTQSTRQTIDGSDNNGYDEVQEERVVRNSEPDEPSALPAEPAEWPMEVEQPQPEVIFVEPAPQHPLTPLERLSWRGSHHISRQTKADDFDEWLKSQPDPQSSLDYEATFMTHAMLYNIACHKDLLELKNMAWQRLRSLLIYLGPPIVGAPITTNLVTLIHYTYRETGISELPVDPLRDLVTTYVAIHYTKFKGLKVDELISSELADDREFVVELMGKIRESMEHLEASQAKTMSSSSSSKKKGKKTKSTATWGVEGWD